MRRERTIYYSDPLHDDFAETRIKARMVDADFPFVRESPLWELPAFFLYYVIAAPIVFVISKVYLGLRVKNRRALRSLRPTGYFLYGNHTHFLDAFLPAMVSFPKRAYVIAGADAVSLPLLKNFVLMLGVIPIPTGAAGMKAFLSAVSRRCKQGHSVTVFPEAHIWPFYTGIRPFPDTSFRYPVREGVPAVGMAVTYRRRKGLFRLLKKPGMTVTLSEPMHPDPSLPPRAAQRELRDRVYDFLCQVSESEENVAYIRYVPMPEADGN